jgi:hypothetical protein
MNFLFECIYRSRKSARSKPKVFKFGHLKGHFCWATIVRQPFWQRPVKNPMLFNPDRFKP